MTGCMRCFVLLLATCSTLQVDAFGLLGEKEEGVQSLDSHTGSLAAKHFAKAGVLLSRFEFSKEENKVYFQGNSWYSAVFYPL